MLLPHDLANIRQPGDLLRLINNLERCTRRKYMQASRKKYYRQALVAIYKKIVEGNPHAEAAPSFDTRIKQLERAIRG